MFTASSLFAQESEPRELAVADYDDGVQLLLDGKAARAARALRRAVAHDSTFLPARRLLGVAYDLEGNHRAALAAYLGVLRRDPRFSRLLYYHTGDTYLRAGQPDEALDYLLRFERMQAREPGYFGLMGEQERPTELKILEEDLSGRLVAARMMADSLSYRNARAVHNLGPPVNSTYNDYFPFFTNDLSRLLFTRQGRRGDEDLMVGRRNLNAEVAAVNSVGDPYSVSPFSARFNTSQPEGMCTLVRDGETIFFTLCHENEGASGCDVYTGRLVKDRIREVERLPDYLNSSTWDSQAAISCDGRELYFASTRPGGLGGSDLYRAERLPDGRWSEPVNLGDGVNTPEDEEAPFLSNDGQTLYFASMGHQGLGDQDIFFSRWDERNDRWTRAVNIGPPINSPARELGFHLSADGRRGFFASNRSGGQGGLDIYGFTLDQALTGLPVTYLAGYVTDSISGAPLGDKPVNVGGRRLLTNADGRFFICARPDTELPVSVNIPEYRPYQRSLDIPTWDNQEHYRVDIRLRPPERERRPPTPPPTAAEPRTEELRLLFAFERADLPAEGTAILRRLVRRIGADRILQIELRGFADEVGRSDYNQRLSERRAAGVAAALSELGIPSNRITYEGLGEIMGRRTRNLNRKVEISVIYTD